MEETVDGHLVLIIMLFGILDGNHNKKSEK